MALQPAVLDVPLSVTNQTPSDTMGPLGRLQSMLDCQVKRYEPHYQGAQGVVPAKIRVEPRDAFNSLPTALRSVVDGTVVSPSSTIWSDQRLLSELDSQLVSICGGSVPRVFNGDTWSTYVNNAILTEKLSQEVFHTSGHTIQVPDAAWLSGVTCVVWTETSTGGAGPLTTTYVGFKADNGAWLRQPTVLYASASSIDPTQARVIQDGTNFWVFFNTDTILVVNVYDTNGARLASSSTIPLPAHTAIAPGTWDATVCPTTGGYTVLAALLVDATSNSGVDLWAAKLSGGTVLYNHVTISSPTIQAGLGNITFLTNDTGNGRAYLMSMLYGTPQAIWGYEITNQAVTHTYNTGVTVSSGLIDSIAGYATGGSLVSIIVSYCCLPNSSPSSGPIRDPQLRFIHSFACTSGGTVAQLRTTQSLCQVSRAFAVDGNYYVFGYYQSGAGLTWQPTKIDVTLEAGDYMIGAATQAVPVTPGDFTEGSPIALTSGPFNPTVSVSNSTGTIPIQSGDFVTQVTVSGAAPYGIPDGTQMFKWHLANRSSGLPGDTGARMTIAGSSIAGANTTWDIGFVQGVYIYTFVNDITGGLPLSGGGTFTGTGTLQIVGMVGYQVQDLSPLISSATDPFYIGGSVTIRGAGHSANNGTFTVARIYYGSGPNWSSFPSQGYVWVVQGGGSQVTANDTFTGTLSPLAPNLWYFSGATLDPTLAGANLVVSTDPALSSNIGTYAITAVTPEKAITTGDATGVVAQIFQIPFPAISVNLTTQVPYTFKLQGVTPDYTYISGIVAVQDAINPANNGTYKIIQVNADGTFVALPTNGLSNQVNESFANGTQTVTIYLSQNPAPEFQSTWFAVPLTGNQPVAGRFEYGLAYADWRTEGDTTLGANIFAFALSTPVQTSNGTMVVLPFRAENVTSAVTQITAAGAVDIGEISTASTVGLKQFWLANGSGQAYANSGELLIPGPMASVYTSSGFFEDNVNIAPEQPFLVSQSVAAGGTLGLTLGSERIYVVVFEQTDENGNRIYSPPSPALVVNMSGTNNVATIGGRLPFPLDTNGKPIASTYGPTCRNVTISIYATAFINGVPTTNHYKITSDLYANGLAPASAVNPSGFSFPDSFTWQFIDQNPDTEIQANEILYTDKGYLPRYPAPAFSSGVGSWRNREWVIGYDGAVWFSGEKTEGDAIWFNPGFRIVLPTDDEPLGLAAMEDYLVVTCANSIWYIPAAQLPDATGANGTIPPPVRLPFQNGSVSGLTQTIREGVAYDSTAGGVWLITRSLDNVWLSHPVQDTLSSPILGLSLDEQQRLFVLQESGPIMVYDGIPAAWYAWRPPTTGVLVGTYAGQAVYQDSAQVNVVVPGQAADLVGGVTSGIAPDVTLASLNVANVRGVKHVWEFQITGTYLGPHRLNVVLSYPSDPDEPDTTYDPFVPSPTEPYVVPFNPTQEEATQFGIRLYADFVGVVTPGLTFAFEMLSAQVGLEQGIGLKKLPQGLTMLART